MPGETTLTDSITQFARLPGDRQDALVHAVEGANPRATISELAADVAARCGVAESEVLGILQGVATVIRVTTTEVDLPDSVAPHLAEIAAAQVDEGAVVDVEALAPKIARLLKAERSIGMTSKAHRVLWGHGRVYVGGDVITQIRPLFYANLGKAPDNSVIVHELRIQFRDDGVDRDVCVTMDRSQLEELAEVLKRAIDKETCLRRDAAPFKYLDAGVHNGDIDRAAAQ